MRPFDGATADQRSKEKKEWSHCHRDSDHLDALFSVAIGTLQHRGVITEPPMACTPDPVLTPDRISPPARASRSCAWQRQGHRQQSQEQPVRRNGTLSQQEEVSLVAKFSHSKSCCTLFAVEELGEGGVHV